MGPFCDKSDQFIERKKFQERRAFRLVLRKKLQFKKRLAPLKRKLSVQQYWDHEKCSGGKISPTGGSKFI